MKRFAAAFLLLFIPGAAWMLSAENTPPTAEPPSTPAPSILPSGEAPGPGESTDSKTEQPATNAEKNQDETKRLLAGFPCFCPQIEYGDGYLGDYCPEGGNCSNPELAWMPGSFNPIPQFCDMNLPGDCDCIDLSEGFKLSHPDKSPAPVKEQPADATTYRLPLARAHHAANPFSDLVPQRANLIFSEIQTVYLKLNNEGIGDRPVYVKVSQVVRINTTADPRTEPTRQSVTKWGGVQITGLPDGVNLGEVIPLTRIASGDPLKNNTYRRITIRNPKAEHEDYQGPFEVIQAKVFDEDRELLFRVAILMSRSVPATAPETPEQQKP